LQDEGYKVAIVTDGRMSGASGKVASAIHLSPEAAKGGIISIVQNGDIIKLDAIKGTLELLVDEKELKSRKQKIPNLSQNRHGMGRELFSVMRNSVNGAENGAATFQLTGEEI
jgi:phosphogluconate dehydratase